MKICRTVSFIIGNIGSGKTTLARKLADTGTIIIDTDSMREMFGCGRYHFAENTEEIIKKVSMEFIAELSARNIDFAIDGCLVSALHRSRIISVIREESEKNKIDTIIIAHILPRITKSLAIKRRMTNPRGISKKVWQSVWDKFDEKYEEPTHTEGFDGIIRNEQV